MKKYLKVFIALTAFLYFSPVFGQQNVIIRGRVIDNEKVGVIGANVIEYDKDNRIINGTICNVNGDFVLTMKNINNTVKISLIGYETKEIKPDPSKPMTVELAISNLNIDEVVVSAQQKSNHGLTNIDDRDNASSTVKINLMDMKDAGMVSASDALQGKVSGLDILSASGDPGAGSQLVIRGLSSMGNNKPLIVVDGIPQYPVPNDFNLSSATSEDISNLVNIALQDIKSIEILKDAASTAVYGSRGADGVLLIETQKGRLGKVQFDYTYKTSFNFQPPPIPMLNGDEYIMLQLEELHNKNGVFNLPPEIAYDKDYTDFYNYSANTDWIGAITQNAVTQDHYFAVSGGGEKTRYFTSLSYVDEGGTTINTESKRFSTRINLDYFLSKKLVFTVQFNYTNNKTLGNIGIDDGNNHLRNVREMAYIKAPNMSIWEYDPYGNPTGEYFTPINSYQGSGSIYYNPVAVARLGKDDKLSNSLTNTFILRYNIKDWLIFRETVSFQYDGSKSNNFLPYNALGTDWLQWTVNKAEEGNNLNSNINTETQVSFEVPFQNKDHVLSGALTWLTHQSSYDWLNLQSNKTPSVEIQDPAINAQINWIGNGSGENKELGGLANINYKYKDKYMLQTSIRADANTSFGINHRWGIFRSVSAAWRFSEEPLFKNMGIFGDSKLRISWGNAGRQPSDAYARFATYASTNAGSYITNTAVVPTQIQLNNLQWESVSSTDFGLELNMFKDRVYIEGDLYAKKTTDLLFNNYRIPYSSGYDVLKFLNGGELENRGWELMTDFKVIMKDKFRWSVNFNISQNTNSFSNLPDNFNIESSTSIRNGEYPRRVQLGQPIGSFFGFHYQGVYSSDADAMARDADGNLIYDNLGHTIPITYLGTYTFKGGDAKYEDVNHDGKIDLNDVVYLGNCNPKYIGGFGTSVKIKNFDFSCGFHYRLGFDIINNVAIQTEGMNDRNNQSKAVLRRWRVQGQDFQNILPRAYMDNPANNLGSDRYVEAGDFLRLLNVMISYRVPQSVCQRLKLRTLTFSASGRRLLTFTNYTGQDPEIGVDATDPFWIGVDNAKTPPSKIMTATISIGF